MSLAKRFFRRSNNLRLVTVLFCAAVGLVTVNIVFGSPTNTIPTSTLKNDRLVVQYKDEADVPALEAAFSRQDAVEVNEIKQLRAKIIQVPQGRQQKIIEELSKDSRVQSVEPDYIGYAEATTPNDTEYARQQYWTKTGVNQLWDVTKGNNNLIVAVIDTGIDFTHPEFANKTVAGYDYANKDADPSDDSGHGTAVSGIIAAQSNNSSGIAGACWNCKIMPVKVLDKAVTGYVSWFADAINYAVDNGASVINMSVSSAEDSSVVRSAVEYAASKNVMIVAAAGNQKADLPRYPAAYSSVLSVAGTEQDDTFWSGSNFGPTIDIAAPGVGDFTTSYPGGGYAAWTGTSFSSPIVAGIAALLRSTNPSAGVTKIKTALTSTADACCNNVFPGGRVNAIKAQASLNPAPPPQPPNPPPTPAPTPPTPPPPTPPPPTPPPTPPTTPPKTGDLNGDRKVNVIDLSILLSAYGKTSPTADINKSGKVDITDLSILLSNWTG